MVHALVKQLKEERLDEETKSLDSYEESLDSEDLLLLRQYVHQAK